MDIDVFTLDHEYFFDLEGTDGYSFGTAEQQAVVVIDRDDNQSKTLFTFADGSIIYLEQDFKNKKVRLKSSKELDPSEGIILNHK